MRKRNNLLLIGSLLISGISLSTLSSCNAVQKENELTSITTSDSELILSINETKTISITCNPSNYDVKKLKYSFDSNIISFNCIREITFINIFNFVNSSYSYFT